MELQLDSSIEVIRTTLEVHRNSNLPLQDMDALRSVMLLAEPFATWCERQTPALVAIRRDIGFSQSDWDELQEVWDEHCAIYGAMLARVKEDQLATSPSHEWVAMDASSDRVPRRKPYVDTQSSPSSTKFIIVSA